MFLGGRAVVSLLLGHIQLHGLQQPEQATISYQRVLEGDVYATIAAMAEKGLHRCRSEDIASEAGTTAATNGTIPDLLKDPFLSTDLDQAKPAPADVVTAMRGCPVTMNPGPCRLRMLIPLPLRVLSQALSQRSPLKPIQMWRWRTKNQQLTKKSQIPTPSSLHPKSMRPRSFWETHGSAFNSSLKSKAPPTQWSQWG